MVKKIWPFLIIIILLLSSPGVRAELCKGKSYVPIKMDDEWNNIEEKRLIKENILLGKYSEYITKESKFLKSEPYQCVKGQCDPVKNCQMEKEEDAQNFKEVNYLMKTDAGINVIKSRCSVIGKCIGYNDFIHSSDVTTSEDRLIDIKQNNAVFYHYFYSHNKKNYEPPFNITNLHTANEMYLDDEPNFSPDDHVIIEVRSVPKQESPTNFPTGFNINIYEMNQFGEYKNVEPNEVDPTNPDKIISTFLSRHPECGETPHFHSWKSNREVRLSMGNPSKANEEEKVILAYDEKSKKWSCNKNYFPNPDCESYLPSSTKFSSNLAPEQLNRCNTKPLN